LDFNCPQHLSTFENNPPLPAEWGKCYNPAAVQRVNPCMTCGACCAFFRVSFYWGESDPERGGRVPADLTEDLTDFYRCMRGTNQIEKRCIALEGEIGESVRCTIYENRPDPCQEFGVHWKNRWVRLDPADLERCRRARAAHGLPPLQPNLINTTLPVSKPKHTRRTKSTRPLKKHRSGPHGRSNGSPALP
jgi:Fe-S-cluster containining protein